MTDSADEVTGNVKPNRSLRSAVSTRARVKSSLFIQLPAVGLPDAALTHAIRRL